MPPKETLCLLKEICGILLCGHPPLTSLEIWPFFFNFMVCVSCSFPHQLSSEIHFWIDKKSEKSGEGSCLYCPHGAGDPVTLSLNFPSEVVMVTHKMVMPHSPSAYLLLWRSLYNYCQPGHWGWEQGFLRTEENGWQWWARVGSCLESKIMLKQLEGG